ncbi:MAG: peptidylprolyl isomerase [Planctomycetota bacterium]
MKALIAIPLLALVGFASLPGEPLRSFFARPLHLEEAPPEVRALRVVSASFRGARGARPDVTRTRDEARALAERLRARLVDGAKLAALASDAPNPELGSYVPGVLEAALDNFLFTNDLGAISDVIETASGFHVFERVPARVGARHLLVTGERGEARARELLARARAGADFRELAREHSSDEFTRQAGGALAIFERGARDALLKAAAFHAAPGEVVGPIETSRGWHLVQRVDPSSLDARLTETTLVRARLCLVTHRDMPSERVLAERSAEEARALAEDFHMRIAAGASFEELAAELNDDLDGRERAGDLGWLHRSNPRLEGFLERLFAVEPGHLFELLPVQAGWVLLARTR